MITLAGVTDTPVIAGEPRPLAIDVTLNIPPGRYVLLAQNLRLRKPAVDILAGLRPPMSGWLTWDGACSWPIGRASFMRPQLTGHQIIDLVVRLYQLDQEMCYWLTEHMLTESGCLPERIGGWTSASRLEFSHILSLLHRFDIYFVDGQLPFRKDRFTELWRPLFSRRIEGRTLILSAVRASDALEYCDAALVLHHGQLYIESRIERVLDDFPVRALPAERVVDSPETVGDATADDDL